MCVCVCACVRVCVCACVRVCVCVMIGSAANAAASPVANTHTASQPYTVDPPNVIGRGKHGASYYLTTF